MSFFSTDDTVNFSSGFLVSEVPTISKEGVSHPSLNAVCSSQNPTVKTLKFPQFPSHLTVHSHMFPQPKKVQNCKTQHLQNIKMVLPKMVIPIIGLESCFHVFFSDFVVTSKAQRSAQPKRSAKVPEPNIDWSEQRPERPSSSPI